MKVLLIFFLVIGVVSSADEYLPLKAPLLSPEERFPVDLNEQARRDLQETDESARNLEIFQKREISWLGLLLVGGGILFAFVRERKPVKEQSPEELIKTIQEESLSQLKALESESLNPEEFYTKLTQIIRQYIERAYQLPAETSTTEEFFSKLQTTNPFSQKTTQDLNAFLESADKIKFARQNASPADCKEALDYALHFIESNRNYAVEKQL